MGWTDIAVIVVAALLVLTWLGWLAGSRLDRLHRQADTTLAALDRQLARRASAAIELGASGVLDPASSVLATSSARAALDTGLESSTDLAVRGATESDLSHTLRAALGDASDIQTLRDDIYAASVLDALAGAWYRAEIARRFYNETVIAIVRVRRMAVVRLLRLAGRTPMPAGFEADMELPPGLNLPATSTETPAAGSQ